VEVTAVFEAIDDVFAAASVEITSVEADVVVVEIRC
jgi:hypothetical protein